MYPSTEFDKMVKFLDLAWLRKDQIVPCLIGPVGIGKTAAVKQHAKNVGANNVVTIIASQILPSEVSGITMPDSSTKSMEIYDHYRLSSLKDGDILFFDELLEAPESVLSACLTLIESRMMMSGKILPDIQIIAATNPTVNPQNIKENIRQRFMFKKFSIDKQGVAQYIKDTVGFNVSDDVLKNLRANSDTFNILSPRSLTKLCQWIASTDNEKDLLSVCNMIDDMFLNNIGTLLGKDYYRDVYTSEKQARNAMKIAFLKNASDDDYDKVLNDYMNKTDQIIVEKDKAINDIFEETSMDELLDMMKELDEWIIMARELAESQIKRADTL